MCQTSFFSFLSGTSESSASSSLLHLSSIVDSITNDEKIKFPAEVSESENLN